MECALRGCPLVATKPDHNPYVCADHEEKLLPITEYIFEDWRQVTAFERTRALNIIKVRCWCGCGGSWHSCRRGVQERFYKSSQLQ